MATPTKKKLKPKKSGLSSLMRRVPGLAGKTKSSSKLGLRTALKEASDRMLKDFKDATKKLSVHQDPKSKSAASLRSLLDQPRKKKVRSPHTDKKNEKRISPKYKDIFKKFRPGKPMKKGG